MGDKRKSTASGLYLLFDGAVLDHLMGFIRFQIAERQRLWYFRYKTPFVLLHAGFCFSTMFGSQVLSAQKLLKEIVINVVGTTMRKMLHAFCMKLDLCCKMD